MVLHLEAALAMAQSQQRKNTYQQEDSLSYLHKTSIVTDTGDPNHFLLEGRGPGMENDIHENTFAMNHKYNA